MNCSSYLYDKDTCTSYKNITFMELGSSSIPLKHHVMGWVIIKEYECAKCSNAAAQVEFLEDE